MTAGHLVPCGFRTLLVFSALRRVFSALRRVFSALRRVSSALRRVFSALRSFFSPLSEVFFLRAPNFFLRVFQSSSLSQKSTLPNSYNLDEGHRLPSFHSVFPFTDFHFFHSKTSFAYLRARPSFFEAKNRIPHKKLTASGTNRFDNDKYCKRQASNNLLLIFEAIHDMQYPNTRCSLAV